MITIKFLYGEYIDRAKLTDQKNPFEHIVPPPPPQVGSEQIIFYHGTFYVIVYSFMETLK